jgi:Flp pilus assembly protein TadG
MRRLHSDSGAVAVEFALVMVPLLLILFGIIDFGFAFNNQLAVTAAAREGARIMAVESNKADAATDAIKAVKAASTQLKPPVADDKVAFTYMNLATNPPTQVASCASGGVNAMVAVTVTVTYEMHSTTGMFKPILDGKNLIGVGVMRCNG